MIRIGILGAGAMGTMHAAAWASTADAKVVGVFSRDVTRARTAATLCGAEPVIDPSSLIGNREVDAIDVCLPSDRHAEVVIAALDAGKHVFCETPLAHRLDEARQMRDVARRTGRLLQVGLLIRSLDAYRHIHAAASLGTYGRLLSLATSRLGSYLRAGAPDDKPHYGDPSTELMTFDFDFIQWSMGRPVRLSASATGTTRGTPGEISALLDYPDGRHATVIASGLMPVGFPFTVRFRALFDRAVLEYQAVFLDGPPRTSFVVTEDGAPARDVPVESRNPFQVELQRFVDCIEGKADPALLDAERAIEALVLSEATRRSIVQAHPIDLA